jgi:hypothetical protein
MTVTFVGTFFVHEHGSRVVVRGERTITTSDGFVGHGTDSFVDNGQVLMFRQTDIMRNATGDHFRARGLFVLVCQSSRAEAGQFEALNPHRIGREGFIMHRRRPPRSPSVSWTFPWRIAWHAARA